MRQQSRFLVSVAVTAMLAAGLGGCQTMSDVTGSISPKPSPSAETDPHRAVEVTSERYRADPKNVEAALAYAKPVVRGGPATEGALAAGAFYRPALLEVEDVDTDLVQQEVFGPVATFEVFDTETDAIARANATEFGLAAGIFTSSINISRRVSREIHAGTVWTNTWAAINDGFAEGGYKQSGIGRLRGPLAITEFQEAKTVVHAIPPYQG